MKEIDTIREVLEFYAQGDWNGDPAKKALDALSTIDPDTKPQEPSEDALTFLDDLVDKMVMSGFTDAAALVTAHDDAIRRECADRAWEWFCGKSKEDNFPAKKESLIIGTEPARESSRAISFDGFFYVFTHPTTGRLESYSSYKNAAAAFDKILATEPARCRDNECESFDCEVCDSRTEPAREGS